MRQAFIALLAVFTAAGVSANLAEAGKVEIKGVHLCCGRCVKAVGKVLTKVEGVADARCDQKAKTVTFTTKEEKATKAALKALAGAGFYGSVTDDEKPFDWNVPAPKGGKADSVVVEGIHVCCKRCQTSLNELFKDAKITYAGKGDIKQMTINGKGLDRIEVLKTLFRGGFYGKVK